MSGPSSTITFRRRLVAASYDALNARGERGFVGGLRERAISPLTGYVLEIGAGTGVNLNYYRKVQKLTLVEPDSAMRQQLMAKLDHTDFEAEVCAQKAETLPFASASFDAVVATFSLCAVDDQQRVLTEARRVLRPDGRLVILDHVRAAGLGGELQDLFTPIWCRISTGCHLNRNAIEVAQRIGFEFDCLERHPGWPGMPWMGPILYGQARAMR